MVGNNKKLTVWVQQHPRLWGAYAGGMAFLLVLYASSGVIWVSATAAIIFGLMNWYIWRPNGPGRGWNEAVARRFPPKK